MQLQSRNFRYRGYRQSAPLVELGKAALSDCHAIQHQDEQNLAEFEAVEAQLELLTETHVAQLQHLRRQLAYRLRRHV